METEERQARQDNAGFHSIGVLYLRGKIPNFHNLCTYRSSLYIQKENRRPSRVDRCMVF